MSKLNSRLQRLEANLKANYLVVTAMTDTELAEALAVELSFLTSRAAEQGSTDTSLPGVLSWSKAHIDDPVMLEIIGIIEAGNERRALAE